MQSDFKVRLSDLSERDRDAFLAKIKFGMATATDIAFYAAQEECPESKWREYALNENENVRQGLACNPKVDTNYFRSLQLFASEQEAQWLKELIEFRETMDKLPDLDEHNMPVVHIKLA
jgi:hypothetical protein